MPAGVNFTVTPTSPDWEHLAKYVSQSAIAQALFRQAAPDLGSERITTVERVDAVLRKKGSGFSRIEIVGLLKSLEKAGLGRFLTGRRGQSTRFEWRSLTPAQVATQLVERSTRGEAPEAAPKDDGNERGEFEHKFRLRRDREVKFVLPHDLSNAEAARLADFIRTLPLG